jgi:hypothetical protein
MVVMLDKDLILTMVFHSTFKVSTTKMLKTPSWHVIVVKFQIFLMCPTIKICCFLCG